MILASVVAAGLALAGCAPASVEEEIAALNERVDTLEKQIRLVEAGGGPSAQLEQEAHVAVTNLNQLVASGKIDEAKAQIKQIGTKYAATKQGRSLQRMAAELAVVGKGCPSDWGIEKWFQGQEAVDLNGDGTMLVVFWETWCPHCRREVPKLQQMYDKFKGDGLQMIGLTQVNKTATEDAVKDIITQNNVSYPIAKENGSAFRHFGVSGVPAAAVVKSGKVVWRGHPARITEAMLQGWLTS